MTSGVVEGSLGRKTKAFQQIRIKKVRYVEPSQTRGSHRTASDRFGRFGVSLPPWTTQGCPQLFVALVSVPVPLLKNLV